MNVREHLPVNLGVLIHSLVEKYRGESLNVHRVLQSVRKSFEDIIGGGGIGKVPHVGVGMGITTLRKMGTTMKRRSLRRSRWKSGGSRKEFRWRLEVLHLG